MSTVRDGESGDIVYVDRYQDGEMWIHEPAGNSYRDFEPGDDSDEPFDRLWDEEIFQFS